LLNQHHLLFAVLFCCVIYLSYWVALNRNSQKFTFLPLNSKNYVEILWGHGQSMSFFILKYHPLCWKPS